MEKSALQIVRLTPARTEDYLTFFETYAHGDEKEWGHCCYCINFGAVDHRQEEGGKFQDPAVRRQYAIDYINKGILQGYLAYRDGKVVGWCNANTKEDCAYCYGNTFIYGSLPSEFPGRKTKAVYCFAIAPAARRQGVATALLERVIADAKAEGFDAVEVYPEKTEMDIYYSYSGHKTMCEKLGFTCCGETEFRLVLRKECN